MNPEVRKELLRVLDQYVVGVANPSDLTRVADKILIDGTYTESLGELTYMRDSTMEAVAPVFESAIKELNLTFPDTDGAALRVVRECALQIVRAPENALEYLIMIRELETYSDMEVDAGALGYLTWVFEGSEELFDEQGKLVEDESEWMRVAAQFALSEAQEWLAKHPDGATP